MIPTIQDLALANSSYPDLKKFMANKEFVEFLKNETAFLRNDAITKQRLWHIVNGQLGPKLCKCGNLVNWNIKNNTYRLFCSSKCAHTNEDVKVKIANTCLERYGVKTNLITQESKDNYSEKMIEKFGVDNPFKSKKVQRQIKDHWLDNHGVSNPSKLDSVKEKITNTNLTKYNRIRSNQTHFSDESYNLKYDKSALIELYDSGLNIKEIADKLNVGHSQLCIQFKNLGIEVHRTVGQHQVYEYIKSIYDGTIIYNDRQILDGKEMDIFLPELNVGFEYDGIFWHSECSANKKNYHVEKDRLANEKGIKLYHILDIEWNNKQSLIQSRIS